MERFSSRVTDTSAWLWKWDRVRGVTVLQIQDHILLATLCLSLCWLPIQASVIC